MCSTRAAESEVSLTHAWTIIIIFLFILEDAELSREEEDEEDEEQNHLKKGMLFDCLMLMVLRTCGSALFVF